MTTPTSESVLRIVTFKASQGDYTELEQLAREDDRSVSALLRLAVREYLDARKEAA